MFLCQFQGGKILSTWFIIVDLVPKLISRPNKVLSKHLLNE